MRLILDLERTGDGNVVGDLTPPVGAPASFHGWLELLRLVEDSVSPEPDTVHDRPNP